MSNHLYENACKMIESVIQLIETKSIRGGTFMIQLKEAVIVEGKYDKMKLSQFIDGVIIETSGFQIFKSEQKREYIKNLRDRHPDRFRPCGFSDS